MEAIYAYNPNKLEVLKENFAVALGILTQIFEADELFSRKMFDKKSSKLFSGTLYEIWTFAIAKRTVEEQIILVKNKSLVREKTIALKKDKAFMRAINSNYSSNVENVKKRFSTIEKLIKQVLNANEYQN